MFIKRRTFLPVILRRYGGNDTARGSAVPGETVEALRGRV
jgi:hypothetical protein